MGYMNQLLGRPGARHNTINRSLNRLRNNETSQQDPRSTTGTLSRGNTSYRQGSNSPTPASSSPVARPTGSRTASYGGPTYYGRPSPAPSPTPSPQQPTGQADPWGGGVQTELAIPSANAIVPEAQRTAQPGGASPEGQADPFGYTPVGSGIGPQTDIRDQVETEVPDPFDPEAFFDPVWIEIQNAIQRSIAGLHNERDISEAGLVNERDRIFRQLGRVLEDTLRSNKHRMANRGLLHSGINLERQGEIAEESNLQRSDISGQFADAIARMLAGYGRQETELQNQLGMGRVQHGINQSEAAREHADRVATAQAAREAEVASIMEALQPMPVGSLGQIANNERPPGATHYGRPGRAPTGPTHYRRPGRA